MRADMKIDERLMKHGVIGEDTAARLNQYAQSKEPKTAQDYLTDSTVTEIDIPQQGYEEVDQTYTQGQMTMPAAFNPITTGAKMQQEALMKGAGVGAARAAEQYDLMRDNDAMLREKEAALEQKRKEEQDFLAQERQKVDAKQAEFEEKPANIGELFQDKTTGGKVLMGLALFLGSAPNSSGQNTAVKVLQDSINADLNKQLKEVEGQRGIYNDLREQIGDADAARMAAYETILKQVQRNLMTEASKYESPIIQANAEAAYGKLQSEIDNLQNAYNAEIIKTYQKQEPSYAEKKELDQFYKDEGQDPTETLYLVDNAMQMLNKGVSTGPIAGRDLVKGAKKLVSKDVQEMDFSLKNIGMQKIMKIASEAGAKSVDSDGERKFILESAPSMVLDEPVLRKKLMVTKSLAMQADAINQSKQAFIEQNGTLRGWRSPMVGKRTVYNPKSGQVLFLPVGKELPSGYKTFNEFVK